MLGGPWTGCEGDSYGEGGQLAASSNNAFTVIVILIIIIITIVFPMPWLTSVIIVIMITRLLGKIRSKSNFTGPTHCEWVKLMRSVQALFSQQVIGHHGHQPVSKFQLATQETSSNPQTMMAFLTMLAMVAMVDTLHASFHKSTFMRGFIFLRSYWTIPHLIHSMIPPAVLYPTWVVAAVEVCWLLQAGAGLTKLPSLTRSTTTARLRWLTLFSFGLIGLWKEKIESCFQQNWIHSQEELLLSRSILNIV